MVHRKTGRRGRWSENGKKTWKTGGAYGSIQQDRLDNQPAGMDSKNGNKGNREEATETEI